MSTLKILIAPWGWPKYYKDAKYLIHDEIVPLKTATGALKRELNPDHTLIIFPDSLAVYYPDLLQSQSYEGITSGLKGKLYNDFLSKPEWMPDFKLEKDTILVSPNVGTFVNKDKSSYLEIKGIMGDYYPWIYYYLASFLFSKTTDIDGLELILDTSHGQNFMSYLTYLALYEIASIIELKLHNKVFLKIYNADPFSKEADFLEINLVKQEIPKLSFAKKLPFNSGSFPLRPVSKNSELSRYLADRFRDFRREYGNYVIFWGAVSQGLPLAVLRFYPENPEILGDTIQRIVNEWQKNIEIQIHGDKPSINRRLRFTEYFEVALFIDTQVEVLRSMNMDRKESATLKELRNISEKIYKDYDVVLGRIRYEIDHLNKEEFASVSPTKWPLFAYLKRVFWMLRHRVSPIKWQSFGKCGTNIQKRNFFAHAGLAKNSIEYQKSGSDFLVKYCDSAIEQIKKFLKKSAITRS